MVVNAKEIATSMAEIRERLYGDRSPIGHPPIMVAKNEKGKFCRGENPADSLPIILAEDARGFLEIQVGEDRTYRSIEVGIGNYLRKKGPVFEEQYEILAKKSA